MVSTNTSNDTFRRAQIPLMANLHLHLLLGGSVTVTNDGNDTSQLHPEQQENPTLEMLQAKDNHMYVFSKCEDQRLRSASITRAIRNKYLPQGPNADINSPAIFQDINR